MNKFIILVLRVDIAFLFKIHKPVSRFTNFGDLGFTVGTASLF